MAMTIPVLWVLLVLLCSSSSSSSKGVWAFNGSTTSAVAIASSLVDRLPDTYTDNTPYDGLSFNSSNVTVPLRTQRDIGLNVTIDHGLWPTVNLSTSYFGTDYSSKKIAMVSEVMAMGYQRLVVDLYWDTPRRQWELCLVPTGENTAPYTCASSSSSFRQLLSAVDDHLLATNASAAPAQTNLYFLILSLHPLTGSSNTSTSTATAAATNNAVEDTLSGMLLDVIGQNRLYTPRELAEYRQNSTAQSWPTWIDLIKNQVQLLVGLGTNDVPATAYNVTNDLQTIFGVGELLNMHTLTTTNLTDVLRAPCPYTNASWATLNDGQGDRYNYSTTLQAVDCGYSPYFTASNYTDANATYTPNDPRHLADNILGTIWSWDVGEPRHMEHPYCATVQRWNGRWRSNDCTKLLRVACRHQDDPNVWILTSTFVTYDRAFGSCPDNYVFDCPRVAIENQWLYQTLQADLAETKENVPVMDEESKHLFWINLNTGDSGLCWVVGLYSTCWWLQNDGGAFANLIRTSAVAGVIVLILGGIFSWVKCARSWRDRKARTRKNMIKELLGRREYVTVPA